MVANGRITSKRLGQLGRKDLIQLLERNRGMYHEWVRRLVVDGHRVDVLAEVVLGYQVCEHHRRMLMHKYAHRGRWSQTLVWRGAGKSTILTVAWSIWRILLNPNVRVLIASKTGSNAQDFLREIKRHFESNEKLREIFGDFVGSDRWDNQAIEVRGRTKPDKEPTINTVGIEGAVASKHYDEVDADDLVDEENSRTKNQRDKMLDWVYKMLVPCLEPPCLDDPFRGSLGMIGTRYHPEDIYEHFQKRQPDGTGGEMEGSTLIIPIVKHDGTPTWPERYSPDQVQALRSMGILRFQSQYMCDCDAMRGRIFRYDDCRQVDDAEIPSDLRKFIGADLAISEGEEADMFAMVCVGFDVSGNVYVLDYMEAQLRFGQQTKAILEWQKKHNPVRIGVEANAYQKAQIHNLRDAAAALGIHDINVSPIYTLKDKVTRAWNLAGKIFENGRVRFRRDQQPLIEHLILFPGYRYKDLFDALDIAVTVSEQRVRKTRDVEPGLL